MKAAEATIHKLKEDAARTKKLVAETRATCANDVRKRDRQIEGLKKAVAEAGRARGERKSAGITTIQVTGDFGGDEMDEDYDLRQESNGHLAQLAKGLSEENDKMKALMHQTFDSLKKMSGWTKDEDQSAAASVAGAANASSQTVAPPANPEELAADLQSVVVYVHNIISNPSYVPIEEFNEEVEVRDREIFRLRDGWEKMEIRWQDAVRLIDGWRRRMAADGRPVDMEELKMGLRLSPVRVPDFEGTTTQEEPFKLSTLLEEEEEQSSFAQRQGSPSPPESLHLVPADDYQDMVPEYADDQDVLDDSDSESSIFQDDVDMDDESEEPNFEILQHSATTAEEDSPSAPLPPPPKITALEETNLAGNHRPSAMLAEKSRKRSGNLLEENFEDTAKAPVPPPHLTQVGHSPQKRLKTSRDVSQEQPSSRSSPALYAESNSSLDSVLLLEPSPEPATTKASSKPSIRPTRPATTTSKKPASAPVKAPIKTVRTVAPEKKETPAKPLTRQRSTRATAPAASSSSSSSSRPARSKREATKTRASTTSSSTTEMPLPPRPTRSSGGTSSPAVQPQPQTQPDKKYSPADTNSHHPPSSSSTKRSQPPPPESPCRSPPKSSSRLPRKAPPHLLPTSQQSPVTVARIAAKLAASEREANAARVRAKLKAAKLGKGGGGGGGDSSATSSISTAGTNSRVASGAGGVDPIKGGGGGVREVSGSTVLSSTSGSVSMDENGTAGGVSILNDNNNNNKKLTEMTSAPFSSAASSARDTAAVSSEEDGGRETIVPSPAKRRLGATPSAAAVTPKKGEGENSVAKDGKRKREVRSRAERVASRRRSTLSPWELQSLITGDVPVPPTPNGGGTEQEA